MPNNINSLQLLGFDTMSLDKHIAIFAVSFNEMLADDNTILFAREDIKENIYRTEIAIKQGMRVIVYEDDSSDTINIDRLVSSGYVIKNPIAGHRVKWCCRLDTDVAYEIEDGNSIVKLLKRLN